MQLDVLRRWAFISRRHSPFSGQAKWLGPWRAPVLPVSSE